jgi:hypothetical protein
MRKPLLLSIGLLMAIGAYAQDVPKVEVPIGFSFINVHPNLAPITSFNAFGGGGQIDINFGNYFGIKGDLMGYTQSGLKNKLDSAGFAASGSGNLFTYMLGPQVKKHTGLFQPFGEALFGGAHTNAYAQIVNAEGGSVSGSGNNNGFAMALGGGIDLRVSPRISLRPVEVDYLLTRFQANHDLSYTANQNNFRYVGGVDFTFGGKPPIPPTASCSASPTEIWAGDPVTATIATQYFNPKHTITYAWSSTGAKVSGTGETAAVATAGLSPGSYTVSATATDEKEKKNNVASCSTSFTVKQPHPPVVSCSASPDTVKAGDPSTINVDASSPDGVSLSTSYSASAGRVTGTGNSATLSTADAAPGSPITVSVTVTDARGLSTGCQTVVNVLAVPVVVNQITEVGSCSFNDSRRPGRVDNVCKATLDDVALKIQREPNNTLVVVGYAEDEETIKATQLAGQRAVNVKYYLTKGEGGAKVDASLVQPRTGADKSKSIKIYMVPPGTQVTETTTPVDETAVKPK